MIRGNHPNSSSIGFSPNPGMPPLPTSHYSAPPMPNSGPGMGMPPLPTSGYGMPPVSSTGYGIPPFPPHSVPSSGPAMPPFQNIGSGGHYIPPYQHFDHSKPYPTQPGGPMMGPTLGVLPGQYPAQGGYPGYPYGSGAGVYPYGKKVKKSKLKKAMKYGLPIAGVGLGTYALTSAFHSSSSSSSSSDSS